MRRLHVAFAASALAIAMTLTAGCSDSSDEPKNTSGNAPQIEKVTYLSGAAILGREAFIYVAMDKGYMKEAGFEVEVKPGTVVAAIWMLSPTVATVIRDTRYVRICSSAAATRYQMPAFRTRPSGSRRRSTVSPSRP